ncbi:MAG: substrate-binding domain-containing protein [Oscillospiraceae bacterium]|nr:substrate-binding domain-containing protein [Oscillospiraceae bacterium]
MKKKSKILVLLMALVVVIAACAPAGNGDAGTTDGGDLTFAIVTKSAGNPFMERMASGFETASGRMGAASIVQHPSLITAEAQIEVINALIAQEVDGIAVAANDAQALAAVLQTARDAGIAVVTLDSDTAGSQMFVNQAGVREVAQVLVDSVYDMTGGSGQFAVLSATALATNQNAWIAAMGDIISEDARYANLEWVATVFGDDEWQASTDETSSLLASFPDLEVIVAPTTVGILAAAQYVQLVGSDVLIAGLGLPSEMLGLVGPDLPTPYMYLWNPVELGEVAAYALYAFVNGDTTGAAGESFVSQGGTTFNVIAAAPELGIVNTQIIVGLPFRFDGSNIDEWAEVF